MHLPPNPVDAFLDLLLRAIPGMAFVVRYGSHRRLEVVGANADATSALARCSERILAASHDAIEGRGHAFGVTQLDGGRVLLVRSPASQMSADERLRDLAQASPRKWRFTRRQREVALLMVQGLSNRDISADLGLRENTIELHVSAILRQTGADNRTQLVAWFWTEEPMMTSQLTTQILESRPLPDLAPSNRREVRTPNRPPSTPIFNVDVAGE